MMSCCSNDPNVPQSASSAPTCEEQQKTIVDVLSHCQVINDAIQNLDKKFDVIKGKVSKIYRFRTKLIWQNRKPLGYAYKHYTYLLSRKVKLQKKKKDTIIPASLSCTESYSPTSPVRRPITDDYQDNAVGTYCRSQDSLIHDHQVYYDYDDQRLSQSPTFPPVYTQEDPPYYTSNVPVQRSPHMPYFDNQGARSSVLSNAQLSASAPAAMLDEGISSLAHKSDMMTHPTLLENKNLVQIASSPCISAVVAASSPVGSDRGMLKQSFPDDPSTWSVEEVILFLQQSDPETFTPIADIFRHHVIDGTALLLLQSDIMIKFMGIKLGTALKLCHCVEKLKVEKAIED